MLPPAPGEEVAPPTRKIHINPNFTPMTQFKDDTATTTTSRSTAPPLQRAPCIVVNPSFLNVAGVRSIHMNPAFFQNRIYEQYLLRQQQQRLEQYQQQQAEMERIAQKTQPSTLPPMLFHSPVEADTARKIITKSRTRIVREAAPKLKTKPVADPFIRINNRKLVRRTTVAIRKPPLPPPSSLSLTRPQLILTRPPIMPQVKPLIIRLKRSPVVKRYKVDYRDVSILPKVRRPAFVSRYALRRGTVRSVTKMKVRMLSFKPQSPVSANKKMELLNINGVLYKSTRTKLQRKDVQRNSIPSSVRLRDKLQQNLPAQKKKSTPTGHALFVRGTKFVMDAQGLKLTRVPQAPASVAASNGRPAHYSMNKKWQRIDIGGITYIASQTKNVLVRSQNHVALAHLNSAKQRSLQLLSRRYAKSNIPCPIFQRLGKCSAYERSKCNKVHDKRQVIICSKFLRNECTRSDCLRSHNVSLAKMPLCKFFVQDLCSRDECRYLHKKLSPGTRLCDDFLRGYCSLADKCDLRHEFVCPELEKTGKCKRFNCMICKRGGLLQQQRKDHDAREAKATEGSGDAEAESTSDSETDGTAAPTLRYFSLAIVAAAKSRLDPNEVIVISDSEDDEEDDEDDVVVVEDSSNEEDDEEENVFPLMRPMLGDLPAYIPLDKKVKM